MAGAGTGRPLSVKCPKCMRGKYGYERREHGVVAVEGIEQREEWRPTRRYRSRVLRVLTLVRCEDCGHSWWTTLKPRRQAA